MIIIKNNIIKIPIKKDVTLTKFINLLFIKTSELDSYPKSFNFSFTKSIFLILYTLIKILGVILS